MTPENCVRRRININDENYYIILGDDFVTVTVPRENDTNMSDIRQAVELVCETVTELMHKKC